MKMKTPGKNFCKQQFICSSLKTKPGEIDPDVVERFQKLFWEAGVQKSMCKDFERQNTKDKRQSQKRKRQKRRIGATAEEEKTGSIKQPA